MLNRLISPILVGDVKKIDGQKVKEVRIVYNFVGEIPEIDVYKRQVRDKSRLSIRLVPPYSEERLAAAREYAKEHGFQAVSYTHLPVGT